MFFYVVECVGKKKKKKKKKIKKKKKKKKKKTIFTLTMELRKW